MKRSFLWAMFLGPVLFMISSCAKDDDGTANDFVTSSEDITTQQDILDANETEIGDQLEAGLLDLTTRSFPVRTWLNPKGTYPNTLTIDYGPDGVTGPHGHVRKGKLIIDMTAPWYEAASVRTVTHENFYIDDVLVEGTVTVVNQGPNPSSQMVWERVVSDRKLTFPSGKTITWDANQTITQLEGGQTPQLRSDDVWSISGTSDGINRAGKDFSGATTEALVFRFNCPWIVSGAFSLTVDGVTISIDYGDGLCNNAAILTLPDGSTKEIRIRRWW
jgi:hypothetical protein